MWRKFLNWLHHIFNPHCEECAAERVCPSCEVLRRQLEIQNENNRQLTLAIVDLNKPIAPSESEKSTKAPEPIRSVMPWRVRKQMLQAEDRKQAEILAREKFDPSKSSVNVVDLENELAEVEALRNAEGQKVN